ncbi:MAG: hypothetical protein HUJ72_05065, partial [Blautia sp.]|nr:hypothetical protein [Blautia sp.]
MKKKLVAITLAGMMGVTGMAVSVPAAESYQEAAMQSLEDASQGSAKCMERYLESVEESLKGTSVTLELSLSESVLPMITLATQQNMSWLQDVRIQIDEKLTEEGMFEQIALLLNDNEILTLYYLLSTKDNNVYMMIPEISDACVKMSLEEMNALTGKAEKDQEGSAAFEMDNNSLSASLQLGPEQTMNLVKCLADMPEYLPSPEATAELIKRYGTIVLGAIQDGEASVETLEVEGVTQECDTFEGVMTQESVLPAAQSFLAELKEDPELKALIEKWAEAIGGFTYEDYQEAITGALDDLNALTTEAETAAEEAEEAMAEAEMEAETAAEEAEEAMVEAEVEAETAAIEDTAADEGDKVVHKLYVTRDGDVIGSELTMAGDQPILTVAEPFDGTEAALFFRYDDGYQKYELTGKGTLENALLNGEYTFRVNDVSFLDFTVTGYDTELIQEGYLKGSYMVKINTEAFEEG